MSPENQIPELVVTTDDSDGKDSNPHQSEEAPEEGTIDDLRGTLSIIINRNIRSYSFSSSISNISFLNGANSTQVTSTQNGLNVMTEIFLIICGIIVIVSFFVVMSIVVLGIVRMFSVNYTYYETNMLTSRLKGGLNQAPN